MEQEKIVVGTRGSQLALKQTDIVKKLLEQLLPKTKVVIKTIKTLGDKNMKHIPLDATGKGWFTKEIDKALLKGTIDLAVHSLKDVLDAQTPGLVISALPKREDAREVLVTRTKLSLSKLKKGAIIGTDSIRRKIQLLRLRPDIVVKSIRGNINTRLVKLDLGLYDGLILAAAGLKRLGLENRITQYFEVEDFIPSPGQGALAIVSAAKNKTLNKLLVKLNDPKTVLAVSLEREFSQKTGGGCSMPVGAYAQVTKKGVKLFAMLGSKDEKQMLIDSLEGKSKNLKGLGKNLAKKMLVQAKIWNSPKYVVLTREAKESQSLAKTIQALGFKTFICPGIEFSANLTCKQFSKYIKEIKKYHLLLFTSENGVKFFMQGFKKSKAKISALKKINIGAVGQKTAHSLKKYNLKANFMPEEFTAKNLANMLRKVKGLNILLAQSSIANRTLKEILEKKRAYVTAMPVYKTTYAKVSTGKIKQLLKKNIFCLTFTSPSAVDGFMKNLNPKNTKRICNVPVISIGPVTTKAVEKYKFQKIITANPHTTSEMIKNLKNLGV